MTNKPLKIASININRILLDSRKKLLLNYCLDQNLDVVGLQEVRFQDGEIFKPNYTFISNSEPERGGTGMLIRKEIKISNIIRGGEGRILLSK
jgi:exonuclease III